MLSGGAPLGDESGPPECGLQVGVGVLLTGAESPACSAPPGSGTITLRHDPSLEREELKPIQIRT